MDVTAVASLATSLSQARTGDAVGVLVLKKAINLQAQHAAQLIAALPQPAASNPPNLGQNIDVRA
ncbi:YjfB family protein [Pseudothauera rhizosphaerae]|uniref:Putative motility protein n=1 Tax=Pseudothauera rhizosphaerae TaxID=2565932 RepID=A0A4S4AC04_9RHOO|nr:YjfB family protein [Pseudothauera rhizosphaerae]THF56554.1 putative motility protein [Pseudothauera rhizosphaerae]